MIGMSFPADRQRFRLQQGVVTGSVDQRRMIEATKYRVDQREYEVFLHQGGNRELVGTCAIEGESAGSYLVAPNFVINFDPSDCEFLGSWDTDDQGIARLQHVWMTVQGA
jgi:hypothetical protein